MQQQLEEAEEGRREQAQRLADQERDIRKLTKKLASSESKLAQVRRQLEDATASLARAQADAAASSAKVRFRKLRSLDVGCCSSISIEKDFLRCSIKPCKALLSSRREGRRREAVGEVELRERVLGGDLRNPGKMSRGGDHG